MGEVPLMHFVICVRCTVPFWWITQGSMSTLTGLSQECVLFDQIYMNARRQLIFGSDEFGVRCVVFDDWHSFCSRWTNWERSDLTGIIIYKSSIWACMTRNNSCFCENWKKKKNRTTIFIFAYQKLTETCAMKLENWSKSEILEKKEEDAHSCNIFAATIVRDEITRTRKINWRKCNGSGDTKLYSDVWPIEFEV